MACPTGKLAKVSHGYVAHTSS